MLGMQGHEAHAINRRGRGRFGPFVQFAASIHLYIIIHCVTFLVRNSERTNKQNSKQFSSLHCTVRPHQAGTTVDPPFDSSAYFIISVGEVTYLYNGKECTPKTKKGKGGKTTVRAGILMRLKGLMYRAIPHNLREIVRGRYLTRR
jgi:hypothetical protein